MHRLVGLERDDLAILVAGGERSIRAELAACAAPMRDALGWTDVDWLEYLASQPAGERQLPAGMPDAVLDAGHGGMTLDGFVRTSSASAAGLTRAHVLALRLYSGSPHRGINGPLRAGCSADRPHPYAATVAILIEALARLRRAAAAASTASLAHASTAALANPPPPAPAAAASLPTLWRGMCDMPLTDEFLQRGGCELGFLSASTHRAVAVRYARTDAEHRAQARAQRPAQRPDESGPPPYQRHPEATADAPPSANTSSPALLLLKLTAPDLPQHRGASVAFLSAFPSESEYLFPPGTHLRVTAPPSLTVMAHTRTEEGRVRLELQLFRVVEALPIVSSTSP